MKTDPEELEFDRKLVEIRGRFVSSLPERMQKAFATVDVIACKEDKAAEAVMQAYNAIHSLCGMAATVGFPAIGRSARSVDRVLVSAFRNKRGLSEQEADLFVSALHELDRAIAGELGRAG